MTCQKQGKQTCDLMVLSDHIVTQNDQRTLLAKGAVAITGDTISAIGTAQEILATYEARQTQNLGASLLMPGLVNAHCHAPMTLLRGLADDLPLLQWLEQYIWPIEAGLTNEMIALGMQLACAEMLRSGTTAFMDYYFHEHLTGTVAEQVGIRTVLGEGFFSFPSPHFPTANDCWERIRHIKEKFTSSNIIRSAVSPHAIYTVTAENLIASYELACSLEIPWQIHCAETVAETERCIELHGKRPIALLESLGLLSGRTTLAHCVDVTQEEITLLAARGVHVVHNPASNYKLNSGTAPVQTMLDAQIPVGLGTDGAASNNQLNMFADMRLAALIGKIGGNSASAVNAQAALDMATRHSAKCIHWPELGQLAPGHPADMVALDLSHPNLMPFHNAISHVVYASTGHEVAMTMVAGKILYHNGKYATINMTGLQEEITQIAQWMQRKLA